MRGRRRRAAVWTCERTTRTREPANYPLTQIQYGTGRSWKERGYPARPSLPVAAEGNRRLQPDRQRRRHVRDQPDLAPGQRHQEWPVERGPGQVPTPRTGTGTVTQNTLIQGTAEEERPIKVTTRPSTATINCSGLVLHQEPLAADDRHNAAESGHLRPRRSPSRSRTSTTRSTSSARSTVPVVHGVQNTSHLRRATRRRPPARTRFLGSRRRITTTRT